MDTNIDALLERKKRLETSLAEAIKTRNAMEGKMQSRYDTQREEWALECEILEQQLVEINTVLEKLESINEQSQKQEVVSIGSNVELRIDEDDPETYIVLDGSGGLDLQGASTLSTKSPVGQSIIGARPGDKIRVKIKNRSIQIEILRVW